MLISSLALQTKSFNIIHSRSHHLLALKDGKAKAFFSSSTIFDQLNHHPLWNHIVPKASIFSVSSGSSSSIHLHTKLNMSSSSSSPSASIDIASNLQYVNDRVAKCVEECNRPEGSTKLVAVSKTKPVELLMDAYNVSDSCLLLTRITYTLHT